LPAHGQWFSQGTLASSTAKTGRHDIAEILLKVALSTINQISLFQMTNDKVSDFLWVLRFPPPIKLIITIKLKYG
jgi:hypothetical protein